MQPTSKKSTWKRRSGAAVLAAALTTGVAGTAAAVAGAATPAKGAPSGASGSMPPGGGPMGKGGHHGSPPEKVTAVGTTSITVTGRQNKTQTITITSATKFVDGKKTVSLSSVKVGNYIMVTATGSSNSATSSGTVTAKTVTVVPGPPSGTSSKGTPPTGSAKGGPPAS